MLKNSYNYFILFSFIFGLGIGFIFMDVNHYKGLKYLENGTNLLSFWKIFWKILFNNLMVGFLISVAGYFTAGLFTILIIIANSINLAYYIKAVYYLDSSLYFKLKLFIFHGPIELFSLFLFAKIGIKGYTLLKYINNDDIYIIIKQSLSIRKFYQPSLILLIAALVESLIIIQL